MIKLNSNYLDRSYADIMLNKDGYPFNSYNINATSDYYSYFYDNLFTFNEGTEKYSLKTDSQNSYGFDFSYLALHDSVLLNGLALNNKCTLYKRIVKSNGLGYISWKNWFSQLYLQNEKLINVINENKLVEKATNVPSQETINLLVSLSPNQQSFSYSYLTTELGLDENTIRQLTDTSYYLNGFRDNDSFFKYLQDNKQEPFTLNFQAIQNLREYDVDSDRNLVNVNDKTTLNQYYSSKYTQSIERTLQSTGIKMNANSSFAQTAHVDLYNGRSIISRDLFLDDKTDEKSLSGYDSSYLDLNVSKFVDIILDNSSFQLNTKLTTTTSGEALKKLAEEVKDNTESAIKGVGRILKGFVKFLPGGKLVTAIKDATAAISGIAQGISSSTKILASLGSSSATLTNTLTSMAEGGIKIAKNGKKSVGLVSQATSASDSLFAGASIAEGIGDVIGGVSQIVHAGTAFYEEIEELKGANNDAGQTSVKYVNWNNLTHVIKSESAIQFYEDTLSFSFSLGQFGIFNTVEEVIKPCLNLLALVQPSKIDFNKMFGPYFSIESLIMKTGLGDAVSSFVRSFLEGSTQIESSIFMKEFWDISIGPGIHYYNCMFDSLSINFSDEKDQNGLPINAKCSLHFISQTPKSILSNYTSQVSFRFGADINLIDLYQSIPVTIKEFESDEWKNSTLKSDEDMTIRRNSLFLNKEANRVEDYSSTDIKDVNSSIKYYLQFSNILKTFNINCVNVILSTDIAKYYHLTNNLLIDIKEDKKNLSIVFNIVSLYNLAKFYAKVNKIPVSKYADEQICFARIFPVKKISNNNSVNVINNHIDDNICPDGEFIFIPYLLREQYMQNIINAYNTQDNFNNYDDSNAFESFFALKSFLNNEELKEINFNGLQESFIYYMKKSNKFQRVYYPTKSDNEIFSKSELEMSNRGFSGFSIKRLSFHEKNPLPIFLSDIFLMYDFLKLTNSAKSNNLNYVADLNVTEEENIFYNKNRKNNVKLTFDNSQNTLTDFFRYNTPNYNSTQVYLKRVKIQDDYVSQTNKCTKYKTIYGDGYTYGFKLSPYDSGFLDMYKEETETTTSNTEDTTNKEEEKIEEETKEESKEEETKEEETKSEESSINNTTTESNSKSVDITTMAQSLQYDNIRYSHLVEKDLGWVLFQYITPDNEALQGFLLDYPSEYKKNVISTLSTIKSRYKIPTYPNVNNKYEYELTYENGKLIFTWSLKASYVENSSEG